jgi:UDP-N-acetylmuramate--alanine ligase
MEHIHFIGIGGTGLSAIALLLAEKGFAVSGSDQAMSPLAQILADAGIAVSIGHNAGNINGADLVVRSSAIGDDNVEVLAARQAGIPVLKRSGFLGRLLAGHYGIAVAGTHGKTTTTAMIAWMLTRLGQDPSYICGGVIKNLGSNAHAGSGKSFVIEADEYDNMFLGLNPRAAIITNIEHDHPDCFPTPADYLKAFAEFTATIPENGLLIASASDPGVQKLLAGSAASRINVRTYAADAQADYQAANLRTNYDGGYTFNFLHGGQTLTEVTLKIPGEHNVKNACAALALASEMDLSVQLAAGALREFTGAGRRFEVRGEAGGVIVIDDYAHHPTAIRATLSAARARYTGRRIWAVWQPHTYSRTRRLFNDFSGAFGDADRVIVTEIYASREPVQNFSAANLVQAMPHDSAKFIPSLDEVSTYLKQHLTPGDILLVLSAGDADRVSTDVLKALRER